MLLVQGRGEMAVLPAVTAVLLHQSAMDTWTDCIVVIRGKRGNGVSACSYSISGTSLNNNLSSSLYHSIIQLSSSDSVFKSSFSFINPVTESVWLIP